MRNDVLFAFLFIYLCYRRLVCWGSQSGRDQGIWSRGTEHGGSSVVVWGQKEMADQVTSKAALHKDERFVICSQRVLAMWLTRG